MPGLLVERLCLAISKTNQHIIRTSSSSEAPADEVRPAKKKESKKARHESRTAKIG